MRRGYGLVMPREKYKAPSDPLEREMTRKKIEPATGYLTQVVRGMARDLEIRTHDRLTGVQLSREDKEVNRVAAAAIISDLEKEHFTNAVKMQFQKDFWLWLLGKSNKQSDVERTQWGKQPCYDDPEVRAYLRAFAEKRKEFKLKLALLQTRPPRGIDQYYLYFKYIVRGHFGAENPDDELSYLEDWDRFVRAFDESRDPYPLDPKHPGWPKPYGNDRQNAVWNEEAPPQTPAPFRDQGSIAVTPGMFATPQAELVPPRRPPTREQERQDESEEASLDEEADQQDDPEKRALDFQDDSTKGKQEEAPESEMDTMQKALVPPPALEPPSASETPTMSTESQVVETPVATPSPQQAELARKVSMLRDEQRELEWTDETTEPSMSDLPESSEATAESSLSAEAAPQRVAGRQRKQTERLDPGEQIKKDAAAQEAHTKFKEANKAAKEALGIKKEDFPVLIREDFSEFNWTGSKADVARRLGAKFDALEARFNQAIDESASEEPPIGTLVAMAELKVKLLKKLNSK